MRARLTGFLAVLTLLAAITGCLGTRYTRSWVFEGVDFTDVLELSAHTFRLTRVSDRGGSQFTGSYAVRGEEWRFEIESWKQSATIARRFSPPLVYLYRGHSFRNGVAFYSGVPPRSSPIAVFIRTPCDFDIVS